MNQDKLAFYTDEARLTAYENKKRRQQSDTQIRNVDPSYRVTPEDDDGSNEVCRACGYINKECKCGHEGDEPNW